MKGFRVIRVFFGVPKSYGNSPGRSIGPYWAIRERERGCLGQAACPPRPSPKWTRGRGCAPSFLPFSLPLPRLLLLLHGRTPSWTRKGGILLGRLPIRPPPFHIHREGKGRRREERRKGEVESLPFHSLFSSFLPPYFGLHEERRPLGVGLSLSWPIRPM